MPSISKHTDAGWLGGLGREAGRNIGELVYMHTIIVCWSIFLNRFLHFTVLFHQQKDRLILNEWFESCELVKKFNK